MLDRQAVLMRLGGRRGRAVIQPHAEIGIIQGLYALSFVEAVLAEHVWGSRRGFLLMKESEYGHVFVV